MALVDYFELGHRLAYLSTEEAQEDLGGVRDLKTKLAQVNSPFFKGYIKLLENVSYRLSRDKAYLRKNHDMWNTNLYLIKSILAKKRNKKWRIVFKLGIALANIQNNPGVLIQISKNFFKHYILMNKIKIKSN